MQNIKLNTEVTEKLNNLIDQKKEYKSKVYTFKSWKIVGSAVVVKTNGRTLTFLPSELDLFFNKLKEISKKSLTVKKEPKNEEITVNNYQPTAENIALKKSLMNFLEELNGGVTDTEVKKGRLICDVANTMVNIQKAEIALINVVKK